VRLLLVLALFLAGCDARKPRIVVWIEIDSLRADALGCYGNHSIGEGGVTPSPCIDALAADGLRFEHAYASAPATIPSLASQLTGQWPWETTGESFIPRLRGLGWRTAGVTASPDAAETLALLLSQTDELARDPGQGLLLFGSLSEPRYPYEEHAGLRFGPSYAGALKGDEDLGDLLARSAQLSEADRLHLRGRYQGEVAFVDRALGAFFGELKRRGWYDEALIVLVADHGEELFERGSLGHGRTLFEESVHVPWIVKLPLSETGARKGQSIPDVVSLIDLPATLLDWIGVKPSTRAGGLLGHSRSLLPALRTGARSERRWVYLRADTEPGSNVWGVIDAQTTLKWLVDHGQDPPRGSLYDLKHDLYEQNDLGQGLGVERAALMQRLRGLVAQPLGAARGAPAVLPEEPWIAWPADLDGAGPALLRDRR